MEHFKEEGIVLGSSFLMPIFICANGGVLVPQFNDFKMIEGY